MKPMFSRSHAVGFRLLLALALMAVTWMAVQPAPQVELVSVNDKVAHALAFVVLAFLVDGGWPERRFDWIAASWLTAYGAFIEGLQSLLEFRTASLADLVADVIGIFIFWFALSPLLRHWFASKNRASL